MAPRRLRVVSSLILSIAACGAPARQPVAGGGQHPSSPPETLTFAVKQESTWNHFFRRGPVAAHLLATSGTAPRLIVAFPAGNAGIGLWLEPPAAPVDLTVQGELSAIEDAGPGGLRGVRAVLRSSQPQLRTSGMVLSSIRVLRDYVRDPKLLPKEIVNQVQAGTPLVIHRTTLDGAHHLELRIEPLAGATATVDPRGQLVLAAAPGAATFDVAMTFLQDDPPLSPIPLDQLITADAAPSERDRHALAFLVYGEKMLAGSWHYLTYFGRDTLLSVRLLMPALRPAAIEGAIGAVLERLDADGEVAHEEDIGEFAALRNARDGRGPKLDPIYDYKMVDDDFMLAPIVARYLLDTDAGKARTAELMARKTPRGETYAAALTRNLGFVVDRARAFGKQPSVANLVGLKPGFKVGDWRDSEQGLGGGRYAYDVNAVLVPAALAATARLYTAGLGCADPASCKTRAQTAGDLARAWRDRAPPLFSVKLPAAQARTLVGAYAAEQGLDPKPAIASITGPVTFAALSLTADGKPVPVMNSDDGFALLFSDPSVEELERIAAEVARPFPAGLITPVGMVIANPAYVTDPELRGTFARDRYHGAVIWSWQQAMMAAGLARQLERADLPDRVRSELVAAQTALWAAIRATDDIRLAEHWSWQFKNGAFSVFRFGEGGADESNAAQLWSTVYLAVKPPAH